MTWLGQQITWMYFTQKSWLVSWERLFQHSNVLSRRIKNQIIDEFYNIINEFKNFEFQLHYYWRLGYYCNINIWWFSSFDVYTNMYLYVYMQMKISLVIQFRDIGKAWSITEWNSLNRIIGIKIFRRLLCN